MIKKYKIIVFVCFIAIIFNMVAKIYLVNEQSKKISILQKVVAVARSGSYLDPDKKPAHHIFTEQDDINKIIRKISGEFLLTEFAAEIMALIDKNHLFVEDSLIFKPEKIKQPDLLKYNTNIIVTGSYIQIKKLISDIQNLSGLSFLNSPSLVRTKDNQNKVKLNVELSVFFKSEAA